MENKITSIIDEAKVNAQVRSVQRSMDALNASTRRFNASLREVRVIMWLSVLARVTVGVGLIALSVSLIIHSFHK